jgi:hypothetical protein
MGVAGHQAAMTALGRTTGWESDDVPTSSKYKTVRLALNNGQNKAFPVGEGNMRGTIAITGIEQHHQTPYVMGKRKGNK